MSKQRLVFFLVGEARETLPLDTFISISSAEERLGPSFKKRVNNDLQLSDVSLFSLEMHFVFKPLLPVLWLLLICSSWIQGQKNEDSNEFLENSSELLDEESNFLAAPCPKKCACSPEGIVDCGGLSLKEFPIDIPETTNHLSLQNNQIEEIFPEELARLYSLETLNLQNNRLTSKGLPEEVFDQLENLNYLYLANNQSICGPYVELAEREWSHTISPFTSKWLGLFLV